MVQSCNAGMKIAKQGGGMWVVKTVPQGLEASAWFSFFRFHLRAPRGPAACLAQPHSHTTGSMLHRLALSHSHNVHSHLVFDGFSLEFPFAQSTKNTILKSSSRSHRSFAFILAPY